MVVVVRAVDEVVDVGGRLLERPLTGSSAFVMAMTAPDESPTKDGKRARVITAASVNTLTDQLRIILPGAFRIGRHQTSAFSSPRAPLTLARLGSDALARCSCYIGLPVDTGNRTLVEAFYVYRYV